MIKNHRNTSRLRTAAELQRRLRAGLGICILTGLVAYSAIVAKELASAVETPEPLSLIEDDTSGNPGAETEILAEPMFPVDPLELSADESVAATEFVAEPAGPLGASLPENAIEDTSIRFFNGRAVRPAKVMWMIVTAYSPDARSCAGSDDGITASNHRVETNGFRLVAADTRVLPMGSMITIPGYDRGQIVPVLDRGGAIKGNRLDVLFPSHEQARAWGVRRLKVTVWQYADGEGKDNWRAIRDSKR